MFWSGDFQLLRRLELWEFSLLLFCDTNDDRFRRHGRATQQRRGALRNFLHKLIDDVHLLWTHYSFVVSELAGAEDDGNSK